MKKRAVMGLTRSHPPLLRMRETKLELHRDDRRSGCSSYRLGSRFGDGGLLLSEQEVRRHLALALYDDTRAPLKDEAVLEPAIRSLGHLDRTGRGVRLHPARCVDGVSPEVV